MARARARAAYLIYDVHVALGPSEEQFDDVQRSVFNGTHQCRRALRVLDVDGRSIADEQFDEIGFAVFHGEHKRSVVALATRETARLVSTLDQRSITSFVFTLTFPDSRNSRRTISRCSALVMSMTAAIITAEIDRSTDNYPARRAVVATYPCTQHDSVNKHRIHSCRAACSPEANARW